MDKKEEKEIVKSNILFAIFSIGILTILTILCVFCGKNNLKNKTEACTNDVVTYSDMTITDLTGTSWEFDNNVLSFSGVSIDINFISNNQEFETIYFEENLDDEYMYTTMYFDNTIVSNTSQISSVIMFDNYKTITITGGSDVNDTNFVIPWLYDNATLQTPPVQEYTISGGLINTNSNISLPLTITESDTISFEFTPVDNHIFNTYQWTITPLTPFTSYTLDNLVEEPFKISFDLSNVTGDLTINIEAVPYISLKGQWVLKSFIDMTITPTTILNNVAFSSNGYNYNNISALGGDYLRYYSDDFTVYVLSLLDDGLTSSPLAYLPATTYNYTLITIETDTIYGIFTTDTNLPGYLRNITYFSQIFRPATQSDLDYINYKNGQISVLEKEYTFVGMFGALIDAPITALKGLLNFTFFGVNLFSFLTLFITLAVVYLCIKMLKGGRKDE